MGIGAHADGVGLHHVLDLGCRGVGDGGLEREDALQAVIIVNDIDVINLIQVLGLLAHRLDAVGHRHILVDDNHLGGHVTTGGILVILQQVNDVARLLHVIDVADDVLTVLLVKLLDHVNGIVGVHLLHLLGDFLVGHQLHQVMTLVLVEFHQDVGGGLVVEHQHDEQRFLIAEVAHQLGQVGRVHVPDLGAYQLLVFAVNQLFEI